MSDIIRLTKESLDYCIESKKNKCINCKINKLCLDHVVASNLKEYENSIIRINKRVSNLIQSKTLVKC